MLRIQVNVIIAVFIVALSSCKKSQVNQVVESNEVEELKSLEPTEYDGEWVFVGMAHPWLRGDIYGWAGYLTIKGDNITANFVRSPTSARKGVNGPGPFFIREEDQGKVSVEYSGKLIKASEEEWNSSGYKIKGACFDGMILWSSYSSEPDAIYIGTFDPPLMFKKVGSHLIYEPDGEQPSLKRESEDGSILIGNDPFFFEMKLEKLPKESNAAE